MSRQPTVEPIWRSLILEVPVDRAFAVFTDELSSWWPPVYTWAGDVLDTIAIEPREGGRCFERGPHGFTCDWGRVLVWDPPQRLAVQWQISPRREPVPNPAQASEIELHFIAEEPEQTRVAFEHRDFERHEDGAADYRAALDTPEGWTYILDCYAEVAEGRQ